MIRRLLDLSLVEWRHARLLAQAQLLMLWRGKTVMRSGKRTRHSVFAVQLWVNLLFGALLPFTTGMVLPERARETVWMGMGCLLAGSLIAGDFALSFLEHRDSDILFHRPVTSRALYAGRLLEIQTAILLIVAGFFTGPSMMGFALSGWNPLFPLLYLLGGLGAVVFLTLAVLGLYSWLASFIHIERVRTVAVAVNGLIAIGLVLSYQTQSLWAQVGDRLEQERSGMWSYLVPPAWFSAPIEMLSAGPRPYLVIQASMGLLSVLVLSVFASRALGHVYQERLVRGLEHRRLGLRGPRRGWLAWMRPVFLVRRGPETVGFELVGRLLGAARLWQSSLIFPAMLLVVAWQGLIQDPFGNPMNPRVFATMFYQSLLCMALVMTLAQARYHPMAGAAWFLQTAPLARYGDLYSGVKKAILAMGIPIYAGTFAALALLWPLWHTFLYVLFAYVLAAAFLHLQSLWSHPLPLSEEPAGGSSGGRMLISIMVSMFLGSGLCWTHTLAFTLGTGPFVAYWILILLGLSIVSWFSRWMLNRLSPLARPPE
ncbi:MAG: hypothetical protein HYY16_07590 [Planctomycetes bacterium]|nr:hypothetical protein [Planctomycetota bacterium]